MKKSTLATNGKALKIAGKTWYRSGNYGTNSEVGGTRLLMVMFMKDKGKTIASVADIYEEKYLLHLPSE